MAFNDVKLKKSSTKITLLRVEPKKFLLGWTSIGGNLYTKNVNVVEANTLSFDGVNGSRVSSPSSNNEWTISNGVITIYSTTAPSSKKIILSYYIFLSTNNIKTSIDPILGGTDVEWLELLKEHPIATESISNLLEGVFSLSSSSVSVINKDGVFNDKTGTFDVWKDAPIILWNAIDSVTNIQLLFQGAITSVSFRDHTFTISFTDIYKNLQNKAWFSDPEVEVVHPYTGQTVQQSDRNRPIPMILGPISRHNTVTNGGANGAQSLDFDKTNTAVCVSFSSVESSTTNRVWGTCKTLSSISKSFPGSGTVVTTFSNTLNSMEIIPQHASGLAVMRIVGDGTNDFDAEFLRVGVTCKLDGDTLVYRNIVKIDIVSSNIVNIWFYTITGWSLSSSFTLEVEKVGVSIKTGFGQGRFDALGFGQHFTTSELTTTGGNKYYLVTFVNNFESGLPEFIDSLSAQRYLNATTMQVAYIVFPNRTDITHGKVIQRLIEDQKLTVETSSIAQADIDFVGLTGFQIPLVTEFEIGNTLSYLQNIVRSTFSVLTLDANKKIRYDVLQNVPSVTVNLSDYEILDLNVEFDEQDLYTSVTTYNPHHDNTVDNFYSTYEDAFFKLLRENSKITLTHRLFRSISNNVNLYLTQVRKRIRFSVKTQVADLKVGDWVRLQYSVNRFPSIASNTIVPVLITSISRSASVCQVEGINLTFTIT